MKTVKNGGCCYQLGYWLPRQQAGNEFRTNANSLTRFSLKKVLGIKGKQCESFKEVARHQPSSVTVEITVAAGGARARIAQHLLWREGMVLQQSAVLQELQGQSGHQKQAGLCLCRLHHPASKQALLSQLQRCAAATKLFRIIS